MVGERESERMKLTDEEMRTLMGAHMKRVAEGQEGGSPFEAYVPPRKVPFAERLIKRVRDILGRGNQ